MINQQNPQAHSKWKTPLMIALFVFAILVGLYLLGSRNTGNLNIDATPTVKPSATPTPSKTPTSTPTPTPTSKLTPTPTTALKTATYGGPFSGAGQFSKPYPSEGTTCIYDDTFSGTINIDLTEAADGSVSGTARVSGTFVSTAVGGSVPGLTCVNSTVPMDDTAIISGTLNSIQFTTHFTTSTGTDFAGKFTGSLSGNSVSGTIVETKNAGAGSATIPVTLTTP